MGSRFDVLYDGFNDVSQTSINNGRNEERDYTLNNLIISARVVDIVLDDSNPILFNQVGGWNGLGTIFYDRDLTNPPTFTIKNTAKPLYPNLKNYPLINEIVYLVILPSNNIGEIATNQNIYYITPVALWNHPHHNGYPADPLRLPSSQRVDYNQSLAGAVRKVTDQSTDIYLGNTFEERSYIRPLLPFEGDVIMEGRWGNSIRFGSTVQNAPNLWSITGSNGDPITILRNGQGINSGEGWIPTTENINIDNSSIYLTSTQNVPLNVSSTNNYKSYTTLPDNPPPTKPFEYHGKQILINSGRLVFNTNQDHLLLSSKKSINLNAVKSINFDTSGPIVLSTSTWTSKIGGIYLGSPEIGKTEPAVMGEQMYELIFSLLNDLKALFDTIEKELCNPFPNTANDAFKAANNINVLLDKYKKDDQNNSLLLSQTVRTAK